MLKSQPKNNRDWELELVLMSSFWWEKDYSVMETSVEKFLFFCRIIKSTCFSSDLNKTLLLPLKRDWRWRVKGHVWFFICSVGSFWTRIYHLSVLACRTCSSVTYTSMGMRMSPVKGVSKGNKANKTPLYRWMRQCIIFFLTLWKHAISPKLY